MRWLTTEQAANLLDLSVNTVRSQCRKGRIAAEKIGRDWIIYADEVQRYREDSLGKPGAPRKNRNAEKKELDANAANVVNAAHDANDEPNG